MVRNGAAKLEREHGKQNIAFVTNTLPDLPWYEMEVIKEGLPEILRQWKQAVERDLRRAGIKPEVVYVVQIHPKRYEKTGEIIPHVHAVFQSRKHYWDKYAISTERNSELWNRAVSNVLGRRIEMPYASNIQKVKKSAEKYLATYMTLGGKIAAQVTKDDEKQWLPKQWWGMTRSLSIWIKENTKLLSYKDKQFIKENYNDFKADINHSPFSWLHEHKLQSTEPGKEHETFAVAILGKVREKFMSMFEGEQLTNVPMSWEW